MKIDGFGEEFYLIEIVCAESTVPLIILMLVASTVSSPLRYSYDESSTKRKEKREKKKKPPPSLS